MATRFEIYKQALLDLERAIGELDQVHASLKDIGLHRTLIGRYADQRTVNDLVEDAGILLTELRKAECPNPLCEHLITEHDDREGCSHALPDDFDYECGCRWGLEVVPRLI